MPLRPNAFTKCWQTPELPVLPFLAPRVFTPWPSRYSQCRANSGFQAASLPTSPETNAGHTIKIKPVAPTWLLDGLKGQTRQKRSKLGGVLVRFVGGLRNKSNYSKDAKASFRHYFSRRTNLRSSRRRGAGFVARMKRFRWTRPMMGYGNIISSIGKEGCYRNLAHHQIHKRRKARVLKLSISQVHNPTLAAKAKKPELLPPRKARRGVVYLAIVNATKAKNMELRWQQKSAIRRPQHIVPVTIWMQAWHRRFSLIQPEHSGFMNAWKSLPHPALKFPLYKISLPIGLKRHLVEQKSSSVVKAFWKRVPRQIRVRYWHDIIFFALQGHPEAVLKILVATYVKPYPPGYAVGNCIDFIISYLLIPRVSAASNCVDFKSLPSASSLLMDRTIPKYREVLPRTPWANSPNPLDISRLAAAVAFLLQTGPSDVKLNQRSVYLLLMALDVESLKSIYRIGNKAGQYWGVDHLFQMAGRFAKARESVIAFEVLEQLGMYPGLEFNCRQMSMLFSTMLRCDHRDDANSYSDGKLWEFMTSRGLKPVSQHYNILIQNAFQRGESDYCWAIYDSMLEDGITPDVFTCSILLKYSKRLMDWPSVGRALGLYKAMNVQVNPFIATDHVHAVFMVYRKEHETTKEDERLEISSKGRPTAFEHIIPIYCMYFDPRPLAMSIGPLAEQYPALNQSPSDIAKLIYPSKETMSIMFLGLLYGFKEPRQVVEAYSYFRSLLSHGDPDLIVRIHQSHIYDYFLMAFGRFSATVDKCPKVVEDMLTTSKSNIASVSQDKNEDIYFNLTPTVYTWSILLQVYTSRGQMNAGERVLEIMQERGISPTEVTWGTLATGYARVQNIPGTLEAVDQLGKLGIKDYPVGILALNRIKDTTTLYATMEAKRQAELANNEDGGRSNLDNEMTSAEAVACERVQLIGEAIQDIDDVEDIERGPWQKRSYWNSVFTEARTAREAAEEQPEFPNSASDGSYDHPEEGSSMEPVTSSTKEDENRIISWTPFYNETVEPNHSQKTLPSMGSNILEDASRLEDNNKLVRGDPFLDNGPTP